MNDPADRGRDAPHSSNDDPGTDDAITLNDVLKLTGLVETGGRAKRLIQEGRVKVNGEVETRRKRRLREGDEVELDGETFVVELFDEPPEGADVEA